MSVLWRVEVIDEGGKKEEKELIKSRRKPRKAQFYSSKIGDGDHLVRQLEG